MPGYVGIGKIKVFFKPTKAFSTSFHEDLLTTRASNLSTPQYHHPRKGSCPIWDKFVEDRNEDDLARVNILHLYISN